MIANRKLIAAAAAVPVALAAGCSKQPRETTAAEAEAAHQAEPPALFAAVPADTPYLFAAVDPWPREIWDMYAGLFSGLKGSFSAAAQAALADDSTPPEMRFLFAAFEELAAQPDAEGYAALGFSTEPRMAIYGLGVVPVVRLELRDAAVLRSTVARLEERSGFALPTRDIAGHDVWWLGEEGDVVAGVAILGNELVATFGMRDEAVAETFEVLVGARELGPSLSESEVRELAEAQGLLGTGVGYLDTRRLAALLLGAGEGISAELTAAFIDDLPNVSEACADAAVEALAHAPRITFGYTEISRDEFAMEGTLELSSELAELVSATQTRMPGLTGAFDEPPLFAMGGAVDLRAGRRVLERIAGELQVVGDACDDPELQGAAAELAASASTKIPPPFSSIKGGMLVVQSLDPAMMRAEGYALAGIDRPATLLRLAKPFVPQLSELDIPSDGSFRPLPKSLTDMVPFDLGLTFAVGDRAVAIAAGDGGRGAAEAAMGSQPDASPLFMMAYDYQRFFDLISGAMSTAGMSADERAMQEMLVSMASYVGPMVSVVTPSERGLRFSSTMEMRLDGAEAAIAED